MVFENGRPLSAGDLVRPGEPDPRTGRATAIVRSGAYVFDVRV